MSLASVLFLSWSTKLSVQEDYQKCTLAEVVWYDSKIEEPCLPRCSTHFDLRFPAHEAGRSLLFKKRYHKLLRQYSDAKSTNLPILSLVAGLWFRLLLHLINESLYPVLDHAHHLCALGACLGDVRHSLLSTHIF